MGYVLILWIVIGLAISVLALLYAGMLIERWGIH
jgi:hypothetical protein